MSEKKTQHFIGNKNIKILIVMENDKNDISIYFFCLKLMVKWNSWYNFKFQVQNTYAKQILIFEISFKYIKSALKIFLSY